MKKLLKQNRVLVVLAALILCAIGSELFARYIIGAGNPVLKISHPTIGYMPKPSQSGTQLHNNYYYNSYGMRSQDFPKTKSNSNEFRVLLIGDSVIAGGVLTDQQQLASEIIQERLSRQLNRPVIVANISCGGWGPKNQVEYIKNYGTFDADLAVWVLSSHDPAECNSAGHPASYPLVKPLCASTELLNKAGIISSSVPADISPAPSIQDCININRDSFFQMVDILKRDNIKLMVVQHLTVDELMNVPDSGYHQISQWADQVNVPDYEYSSLFKQNPESIPLFFRDYIHINALGQQLYAEAITKTILKQLGSGFSN